MLYRKRKCKKDFKHIKLNNLLICILIFIIMMKKDLPFKISLKYVDKKHYKSHINKISKEEH